MPNITHYQNNTRFTYPNEQINLKKSHDAELKCVLHYNKKEAVNINHLFKNTNAVGIENTFYYHVFILCLNGLKTI